MIPDRALAKIPGRAQYEMAQHGASIRLGGDDPDTFVPEAHSEKWGGKCWLKIRHADADEIAKGKKAKEGKHPKTGKSCVEIDHGRKKHRISEGSVKWEIEYTDASDLPADRLVRFTLDYPLDQLTWHYQAALTAEEIAEGCVRPDDVVDSWAAYWPESGRILAPDGAERVNYETGKYCHSFRWKWLAGDGAEIWAHHWIDGAEMAGECPSAEWLNAHPGPYTLDPTFGYTSAGATTGSLRGVVTTLGTVGGVNGTLDKVSYYFNSTRADNYYAIVYLGSSMEQVAYSSSASAGASGWKDFTLGSESVSASTGYYCGVIGGDASLTAPYNFDTAGAGGSQGRYKSGYIAPPPGTLSGYSNIARFFSAYATYTEAAGGTVIPAVDEGMLVGGLMALSGGLH